ncbi:hypothetical protein WJX74_003926 [Apatococcus lobatus]|uniref:Uncharacterized protein n=1 Tax=Apatococcus lobatus TaxID=904363 RepID=A0AAW1S5W1_9CHLO
MGVVPQDGSTSATLPAGYPPQAQHPPASSQYPPNSPQYPPPAYPQRYEPPHAQGLEQSGPYGQSQAYAQEPPGSRAQPGYAQQTVPAVGVPAGPVAAQPVTYASTLRPQPTVGMPTRGPARAPAPGDVLLGYEICQPESGCCKCDGLSSVGMLSVILLLFFFFPLACLPCCMPECYEPYQRPVYGRRP